MAENNFRIRTDVGNDKVVRVNMTQEFDFLEILSLKIGQKDTYKLHTSDYGVVVGRVIANGGFGVPNAKVSVFIELDEDDKRRSEILSIYPYRSIETKDSEGRRYNLLPDSSKDECYKVVGTFPNKLLILNDDTQLEVFEKYWKYTTVTNKSGDYMIFGVPTGNQQLHVDIDLSDCGVLSQQPIDMQYKGYNSTLFENAKQFKEGTNLDNLAQLISQNNSVYVYPFWGDSNMGEIAITRCDVQVQYKFEPTCVFFGAIVSDDFSNNIGHNCTSSKYSGYNSKLVAGEGTIEMIRKTPDNLVEEFQIQGNRLIDGDGVWAYQIPMNLDYVTTDEYGNIVPTDNPNKGIPTRTSVRFRVSMEETNNEGVARHRAKYLIPNGHKIISESGVPKINGKEYDRCFEFGSATPDEYFRDLYWNKVYSVKNYIPRIQTNKKKDNRNYNALRSTNLNNNVNPAPFNHGRFRIVFAYRLLCMIMTIIVYIVSGINRLISGIVCLKILWVRPFKFLCSLGLKCISISGGLTGDSDENIEYFPGCKGSCTCLKKCSQKPCTVSDSTSSLLNVVQQSLAQEYDLVNLDFYNDWLNGSLYMPLWFWKKMKKRKYFFGLFSKPAVNSFCSCDKNFNSLRITEGCALSYDSNYAYTKGDKGEKYHEQFAYELLKFGVIKEFTNNAGLKVYYYAPGVPTEANYRTNESVNYIRLYSTDIILLGTLNNCDMDGFPNVFPLLPSTTANIPFIATVKKGSETEDENNSGGEGTEVEPGTVEITGMDWLKSADNKTRKYGDGLFFDISCTFFHTKPKTCVNISRMCELGVVSDMTTSEYIPDGEGLTQQVYIADGMITRYEIVDNETRAMFASLNHNGLDKLVDNPNTGYRIYDLSYLYPTDFDGHMKTEAPKYTRNLTNDLPNESYTTYRLGRQKNKRYQYSDSFPLFNNSFYFYFGLNEGKTAIDKLNERYYASCNKNTKYPFTMSVSTTGASWCTIVNGTDDNTKYGAIEITFDRIKKPYKYVITDELDSEIISQDNVEDNVLTFGFDVSGKNRTGRFQYYLNGKPYPSNDKAVLIDNGTYKITVTDANGNQTTQPIILSQSQINASVTTRSLGVKYYDGDTERKEICNNMNLFGEIIIEEINVDGEEHTIKNVSDRKADGSYDLTLDDGSQVKLEVNPMFVTESEDGEGTIDLTISECGCEGEGNKQTINLSDGVLRLYVWRPGDYTITITQKCGNTYNDNISETTVTIDNGKPFNMMVNEMPYRFLMGKDENNAKFLSKGATTINTTTLSGWLELGNPQVYIFDNLVENNGTKPTKQSNLDIWQEFVQFETVVSGGTDTVDGKPIPSNDGWDTITTFKLMSMFQLMKGSYIEGSGGNDLYVDFRGGKTPIVKVGHYPQYTTSTDSYENESAVILIDTDLIGYVSAEARYPNVICSNYGYWYNEGNKIEYRPILKNDYAFNPLFVDYKNIGNYFAVFGSNAGDDKPCSASYQKIPSTATACITNTTGHVATNFGQTKYNSIITKSKPYFRTLFVDRRFDYDFIAILPQQDSNIIIDTTAKDDKTWVNGRVYGDMYNGIDFAYNGMEKNIVGTKVKGPLGIDILNTTIIDGKDKTNNFEYIISSTIGSLGDGSTDSVIINQTLTQNPTAERKFYSLKLNNVECADKNVLNYPMTSGTYPRIRKLNEENVPPRVVFDFQQINCALTLSEENSDYTTATDDTYTNFSYQLEEGETTEFRLDCSNAIQILDSDLNECATNNTFNLVFSHDSGIKYVSSQVSLRAKVKKDAMNSTHNVAHYIPIMVKVNVEGGTKNLVKDMRDIDPTKYATMKDYETALDVLVNKHRITNKVHMGWDNSTVPDGGHTRIEGKYWWMFTDKDDNKKALYEDDSRLNNIVLEENTKFNKTNVLGIALKRIYLNNENDLLKKSLITYQITSLYDVRPLELSYVASESYIEATDITSVGVDISADTTVTAETTVNGSVDVTGSTSPSDSGSTSDDVSASGTIDASADTSASATTTASATTSAVTFVQYTTYKLSWDANHGNQSFINAANMDAIFVVKDGKQRLLSTDISVEREPALDDSGNVESQENAKYFYIKVKWGGSLLGYYVDTSRVENPSGLNPELVAKSAQNLKPKDYKCELFIKMPNGLIAKIDSFDAAK